MRVCKDINIDTYINNLDIITNYKLVDDDFDYAGNDMVDVTNIKTLRAFYMHGRFSNGLYRKSLKTHILPKFDELDYSEKKLLINKRIYPENYTKDDIINIIGDEQYEYINRNISDSEQIENILLYFNQYSAYVEDVDQYEIRNTNYKNILSLKTNKDCINAKYRISWSFQIANNSMKSQSFYRVRLDGDTIYETEINFSDKNTYIPIFNFSMQDLTEGEHVIDIDVSSGQKSTTKIKNSRIEFWKIFE